MFANYPNNLELAIAKHVKTLLDTLSTISNENIIPVARAFSHFLNLTNIAEQYQTVSRQHKDLQSSNRSLSALFQRLKSIKYFKRRGLQNR